MRLRRYESVDREPVWQLHNVALRAVGTHPGSGPWDDNLHHIESVYLNDSGEFLIGTYRGQVVAMGALKKASSERAEIVRMRVDPAFQRRGLGRIILMALEERAIELGYTTLCLATAVQQRAARRLYAKNGYRESCRARIDRFDCVFYQKAASAGADVSEANPGISLKPGRSYFA